MDKEFLKQLNILYVEDDDLIRQELYETLKSLFNNIYTAIDGSDALDVYNQHKKEIDIVISDINMPKKNGIELLNIIRKKDKIIPFIFTTAYTNHDYLIGSIKFGVSDYFVKPLNIKELLSKVEELTKKSKKQKQIEHYQHMINEFLDTINKVAFVFVFDDYKKITYINDFYKEVSKLDSSDVIDKELEFIYHKDIPKKLVEEQWKELSVGNQWKGSLKFKTKDDSAFYSNCTIIPVEDEGDTKYISINFITTEEENSRREFKKKVLYNFNETKKIYRKAQNKIDALSNELERYKGFDKKVNELEELKKLNNNYITNIDKLEKKLKEIRYRQEKFTLSVNHKIKEISESTSDLKESTKKADKKIIHVDREIKVREQYIKRIEEELEIKKQKVSDLMDVLEHRDSQVEEDSKEEKNLCELDFDNTTIKS